MPKLTGHTMGRRQFLGYGGLIGLGPIGISTDTRRDDRGDRIVRPAFIDRFQGFGDDGFIARSVSAPAETGRIRSSSFEWISPGSPRTENEYGLRLRDRGGVDVGFRIRAPDDLTIDTHFRHHAGSDLAYLFNDADSIRSGFRAFTNGRALRGLYFRNTFGGNDIDIGRNVQDGKWHWLRVVLDSIEREFSVFLDGDRVGGDTYDGRGWESRSQFRLMGRVSGTSTLMDYDRFVIVDRAIYPREEEFPTSSIVQYELDDGHGSSVQNAASNQATQSMIDEKRELIGSIRSAADSMLPTDRVVEIDRRAESLLDFIEADGLDSSGIDEVLDNLLQAETVTRSASERAVEPARRTGKSAVFLGKSLAIGRALNRSLKFAGWVARRLRSMFRDIANRARRQLESLLNRPLLSPSHRHRIDSILLVVADLLDEYIQEFETELFEIGEDLLEMSVEGAVDRLPERAKSDLETILDSTTAALSSVIYDRFIFATDTNGTPPAGIHHAIEAEVDPIAGAVESEQPIAFSSVPDRETIKVDALEEFERLETNAGAIFDAMETAAGAAGSFALVIAVIAMGVYVVAIASFSTGIGSIAGVAATVIGSKLQIYAAAFGAMAFVLTAGQTVAGVGTLQSIRSTHQETVEVLLEREAMT